MFKIIQSWPEADRGDVLSEDERAAIEEGLAEANRGEFLDEAEVFREFLPELAG